MKLDPQESILSGCFEVIKNFAIVILSVIWSCSISYFVASKISTPRGSEINHNGLSLIFNLSNTIGLASFFLSFGASVFCLFGLYRQKISPVWATIIICISSMPVGWIIATKRFPENLILWEKTTLLSSLIVLIPGLFYGIYARYQRRQWELDLQAIYDENHSDN